VDAEWTEGIKPTAELGSFGLWAKIERLDGVGFITGVYIL